MLARRHEGQQQAVIAIAWKAQQRLHRSWRRLDGQRGKRRTVVAVAVARQLAGFCWALATYNHHAQTSRDRATRTSTRSSETPTGGRSRRPRAPSAHQDGLIRPAGSLHPTRSRRDHRSRTATAAGRGHCGLVTGIQPVTKPQVFDTPRTHKHARWDPQNRAPAWQDNVQRLRSRKASTSQRTQHTTLDHRQPPPTTLG